MRIRDAVHGFIHYDEHEQKLIDSRPLQRLRNIKQLSFCCYVYPGAMHTRFEHSLGVMELATRLFDHFSSGYYKDQDIFRENFTKPGSQISLDQAKKLLRFTALLHDCGHLPFSHSGESILPEKMEHEDVSISIVKSPMVVDIIGEDYVKLVEMLLAKKEILPELRILRQIISGEMDADRMDYLLRDSHHCGVGYGNFDYRRLIETLRLKPDREGGIEIAIEKGGVHSLEAMILARYYMFTQVYYHRVRRIYDKYYALYLKEWAQNKYFEADLIAIMDYDDGDLIHEMKYETARDPNSGQGRWAKRILERRHHKVFFETDDHAKHHLIRKAKTAIEGVREEFGDIDFIIDELVDKALHKFYTDDEQDRGVEFTVLDGEGPERTEKGLWEESSVLTKIPKTFGFLRVYAEGVPERVGEAKRKFRERMAG